MSGNLLIVLLEDNIYDVLSLSYVRTLERTHTTHTRNAHTLRSYSAIVRVTSALKT